MIIVIGLDLDLISLLFSENPSEEIGYVDKENKNIRIIRYLGTDDGLYDLSKFENNKFVFGLEDFKKN